MARTTPELVIEILRQGNTGGDYDTKGAPSLTGYIEAAGSLVDDVVACAARKGITLGTAKQELLERWLGAHAYAMSDQPYKGRRTLRASGEFQGETKMHLEATKYGQMAMDLDPSGCLRSINSGNRVRAFWLGKRPSEQTDYSNRE